MGLDAVGRLRLGKRYAGREFEDFVRELAAVLVGVDRGDGAGSGGEREPGIGRGRLEERPRPRPGDPGGAMPGPEHGVVCKWRRRWVEQGFSLQDAPRPGRPSQFPDWVWALVIAVACELPSRLDLPLSRHFASSVWQVVRAENVVISLRTVQRMLARHHLKPRRYASWMHPRDPNFVEEDPDHPRPLRRVLGGPPRATPRPDRLRRREDLDPGPATPPGGAAARPAGPHRERLRTVWRS